MGIHYHPVMPIPQKFLSQVVQYFPYCIKFAFNLFTFTSDLFPLYGFLNHETNAKTAIGAVIPK